MIKQRDATIARISDRQKDIRMKINEIIMTINSPQSYISVHKGNRTYEDYFVGQKNIKKMLIDLRSTL